MMSFRRSSNYAAAIRIDETGERRGVFQGRHTPASAQAALPDPSEPADLYYRRPPKSLTYRHFDSAGAAIDFVRDNLAAAQVASCVLQVGERRFEGSDVAAMVQRAAAPEAPMRRRKKLDA
jgi:hypothetical protein